MKITVIGCGRWGTLIAWYLDTLNHDVTLYGRKSSPNMERLIRERRNNLIELSDTVKLCTDLSPLAVSDVIVISVNSQGLRTLLVEINKLKLENKIFVLCMKGLEISTGMRLSEVAEYYIGASNTVAVWLGPGHVQEFYAGVPNCMVIDSKDADVKKLLVDSFNSELIRFYYGQDLIGNEIGAAAKNVIGIAAGMLDGIYKGTLKGALMSRGTMEVARLISAAGGNERSAYGLCHLGDYEATVFSEYSHNRRFGEAFIRGEEYKELAEGYYTAKAIHEMAERYGVEMPICEAVYNILYLNKKPQEELSKLFKRTLKKEFY